MVNPVAARTEQPIQAYQFHLAVCGDQEVVGLQISVQDPFPVAECNGLQGHLHVRLDVGGGEHCRTVLDDLQ